MRDINRKCSRKTVPIPVDFNEVKIGAAFVSHLKDKISNKGSQKKPTLPFQAGWVRKHFVQFLNDYPVMGVPLVQPVSAATGMVAEPSTVEPDTTPV